MSWLQKLTEQENEMFDIMASVIRTATRTGPVEKPEDARDVRCEERRRRRDELDRELRFRRGYW